MEWTKYNLNNYEASTGVEDNIVEEYKTMTDRHITRTLSTPLTLEDVKEQIKCLEAKDASSGLYKVTDYTPSKKKTFFEKVSTFFSRKG